MKVSVTQLCPTLCDTMDCSPTGSSVHRILQARILEWVAVPFSSESPLSIRWPKCWSFSLSPSSEYSGLIFFRIDWLDLLAIQGTLKSLLQHHSSKASILWCSAFLWSNFHIHTWPLGKPQPWLHGSLSPKWCICFLKCSLGLSQLFFRGASVF